MLKSKSEWIESEHARQFGNPDRCIFPAPRALVPNAIAQESWWFTEHCSRSYFLLAHLTEAWFLETVVLERVYFVATRMLYGWDRDELIAILKRD